MSEQQKTLVITGGHHTSALALALRLKAENWNVVWFGHRHSMWGDSTDSAEFKEVTSSGLKFYDLKAGKMSKTLNPLRLMRIPWGFIHAFFLLLSVRPKGIVSFGGYLAVPTVIIGWILGIPSITHEQTVIAGWANKVVAIFARIVAVSWPTSTTHYPKSKVVLTGLPVGPAILSKIGKSTPKKSGPHSKMILITGGKQGSHAINEVIFASLDKLLLEYSVVHQTGSTSLNNDFDIARSRVSSNYLPLAYIPEDLFAKYLLIADVVISRSGAHSIYYYALLGKRCVLIPLPSSSHGEQEENAKILANNNQAVILPQSELTPQLLLQAIQKALSLKPKPMKLPIDALDEILKLVNTSFN